MEIVDKRRKTDEWHAGDVVCYYNNFSEKPNYGLIVGPTGNNEYYIALDRKSTRLNSSHRT